jgi:hypothetical protein
MEVTLMHELLRRGDILNRDCVVRAVMTALPWESSCAAANQFCEKPAIKWRRRFRGAESHLGIDPTDLSPAIWYKNSKSPSPRKGMDHKAEPFHRRTDHRDIAGAGSPDADVCRKHGISSATFYE